MAPEQMEGVITVDARTDIWALGTILYEILIGKPPFSGESLPQIFVRIMRSPTPRPSALRKRLPDKDKIDAIVARCLAIDPDDRFQSVGELAWALSAIAESRAHGRETAARISRVLAKQQQPVSIHSSGHDGVSSSRLGLAHVVEPRPQRNSRALRTVASIFGSAVILSSGAMIGVLAAHGALERNRGAAPTDEAAPTREAPRHDPPSPREAPVSTAAAVAEAPPARSAGERSIAVAHIAKPFATEVFTQSASLPIPPGASVKGVNEIVSASLPPPEVNAPRSDSATNADAARSADSPSIGHEPGPADSD